jgi:hypothetical protein
MKLQITLSLAILTQAAAAYFADNNEPLVLSVSGETNLNLATSRRTDHPNLRYALNQSGNLVSNAWLSIAEYSGDGSAVTLTDADFSLASGTIDPSYDSLDFSRLMDGSTEYFYRISTWLENEPLESYIDDVDRTYVRLRSLDSDKFLYQGEGSPMVGYTSGMARLDFRSHWFIQSSPLTNRYWITNRLTGESILTDSPGVGVPGATILVDFGTDGTYRGASVSSPDSNGNYWNEVGYSPAVNMLDADNNGTDIDLYVTSSFGNDFYNGPAGAVQNPASCVYNAVAIGELGIDEAVYDYFVGDSGGGWDVTFEIRDLDPAREYSLTFFGSHKYNTDNTTRYSVTESGGTVIDSVDLTVGVNNDHNQDTTVTLASLVPDVNNKIYVKFAGTGGNGGCLNTMKIEVEGITGSGSGSTNLLADTLVQGATNYQWIVHEEDGYFRIESAAESAMYCTVGTASTGTAIHASLDTASPSQKFSIEPLPRGALLPWTAYDEDNYTSMGSGAQVLPPTYDRLLTESEAQKRSAVLLNQEDAYVKWTLTEAANVFTLRYAIEDAPSGGGLNGTLSLEIRDGGGGLVESTSIPVTSEQAWIYFDTSMNESDDPADGRPAKRFNEARVKLSSTPLPGYTLELRRGNGEPLIWIDVVETELDGGPITVNVPAEYLDVTDYGAVPDDGGDDRTAFINCINAAKSAGKGVYIPAGEFRLNSRINIGDVEIQGAGMWHTELLYTTVNGGVNNVGFWGDGSGTIVRDLYMRALATERGGGGNAFRQYFGTGSRIENVWAEHFDVGAWIGDYISPYDVSDGLIFFNCRFRNTFADGINLARGTKNSAIDNCHFRGTGDDSTASWSSDTTVVPQCINNRILYNTIEGNWRAAGVGIFGGESHKVHHNIVSDVVSGAALRFNTTFANGTQGYEFSANGMMRVYKNSLYRSGTDGGYGSNPTKMGAINLVTTFGNVRNITFEDTLIDDVLNNGVYVTRETWGTGGSFTNIVFDGMLMTNMAVGTYVNGSAIGEMEYIDVDVELHPVRGIGVEFNFSSNFDIIHTP